MLVTTPSSPVHVGPATGGKDLQDLQGLKGSPLHALRRRITTPSGPRGRGGEKPTSRYPLLAAFASSQTWKWVFEYLKHRLGRRHPFQTYSGTDTGIYPLQGDGGEVRIALAGDWGTGTDEAAMVAEQMEAFAPHYTVHVGDVYYVGDGDEVAENFLGQPMAGSHFTPVGWPRGSRGSFSLLGNHEMFARGIAYFTRILPALGLAGDDAGQQASFFCLENEFWRIIAVDTSYNSVGWPFFEFLSKPGCALPKALMDWLEQTVKPDPNDPRGIILLSHHQYFSAFEDWFPKPASQLSAFFKRPVLWFWGHEHRMTLYDRFSVKDSLIAYGRCIGHGGMPVDLPPDPPPHPECPVLFIDKRLYANDEKLRIGMNGFARLAFRSEHLQVDYVDLHGTTIYSETWRAAQGEVLRVSGAAV